MPLDVIHGEGSAYRWSLPLEGSLPIGGLPIDGDLVVEGICLYRGSAYRGDLPKQGIGGLPIDRGLPK